VEIMPDGQLRDIVHFLRRVVAPGGLGGVSDAELLERFARGRDEAAFELLVWRHGKMVLGVCRRLLRQEQDAEDAFQAAFLALARRAGALGRRASVGGWLYRVAFRIALRARAAASRRSQREQLQPARRDGAADPAEEAARHELRQVIDEEVNRLPEKYRVPFVLCHFGGRSNAEVARELGCPVGTLESWLVRARQRLRGGLTRRGVALPAGLFAAGLEALLAPAEVSAALVGPAARAALLVTTGQATVGLISAQATAWAEGALRTMCVSKLKIAAVVVLTAGLAGTGVGGLSFRPAVADQAGPGEGITSAPRGKEDDRIGRLIRQLGSDRFAEREKATKELDKIGAPALDALREAARSGDPEVRRRAGELANKIEERTESDEVLRPKRVHLIYKDTPLLEAVSDFQRKCGYLLSVREADELKKRTVTLDTGDVTFWEALDLFCKAAGLVEAGRPIPVAEDTAIPMMPPGNPFQPGGQVPAGVMPIPGAPVPAGAVPLPPGNPFRPVGGAARPGGALPKTPAPGARPKMPPPVGGAAPAAGQPDQPVPAGRSVTKPARPAPPPGATPAVPATQPLPPGAGPAVPPLAIEVPGQPAVVPGARADTVPAQKAPPPGVMPAVPAPPAGVGRPGQPAAAPPGLLPAGPVAPGAMLPPGAQPGMQVRPGSGIHRMDSRSESITLREGQWKDAPTVQVGAIRLRLIDKVLGPADVENALLALQIAAEPKVGWRAATDVRIDKAVDDQGQSLSQERVTTSLLKRATDRAMTRDGLIPACGSLMPLCLKKGEKPATKLKELRGSITAEVVPVKARTILTVDDVLKTDGKTFKLPGEGTLKIVKSNSLPQGVTYGGKASEKERADWVSILVEFHDMPAPAADQLSFELTLLGDKDESGKPSQLAKVPSFLPNGSGSGMLLFYGPLPKGEKSAFQLVLGRRKKITVTIPFTFKDVPLP
jgi:RNA polymerase sigma factor (sigma-70 family)